MNHENLDPRSLLDEYGQRLQFYAYTLLDDKDQAGDAVADVFIRLIRNNTPLNNVGNIKAFLYASVRNSCLNVLRKGQVDTTLIDPAKLEEWAEIERQWATEHSHNVIRAENRNLLAGLIRALPPREQEIICRRFFNNEKIFEIAAHMGISEYLVRTHYDKAINQMKINALRIGDLEALLLVVVLAGLADKIF